MKPYKSSILFFLFFFLMYSCNFSETNKELYNTEDTEASEENVASMIEGTYEGLGFYTQDAFDAGEANFTNITFKRIDNTSVEVFTNMAEIPTFEIIKLENLFGSIVGNSKETAKESLSFNKSNNTIRVLLHEFKENGEVLRFVMQ